MHFTRGWMLFRFLVVVVCVTSFSSMAQQISVSGKITSSDGAEGLPGTNIIEKGTTNGTVSNADGSFALSTDANATLVISSVGYITQEVAVNNRSTINLTLQADIQQLAEIIVVGYGTQKKSDVTGSVVQIDDKAINEVPAVQDVTQALKGRLAGVDIVNTGSTPGSESQIRIRGSRSLGSDESGVNNPLIVLDGIPYSGGLNDINPNDIQSVNILKDASATAIYGSRGANGVILITTKRGTVGKAVLRINSSYGFISKLDNYELFNGDELLELKRESNFGGDGSITPDELDSQANGQETNWQDLIAKRGYVTSHDIGVSGGTEATQYNVSLAYFDQTSVLPGQGFKRYSLRTNLDQQVGERFKFGLSLQNSLSFIKGDNINPYGTALGLSPYYKPYEADGVTINPDPAAGHINDTFWLNPLLLYEDNGSIRETRTLRTFNTAYAEIEIIENLRFRMNLGLDYRQDERGTFNAAGSFQAGVGGGASADVRNRDAWSYTVENLLLYDKTFGEHRIGFTGLFSVQEQESNGSGFEAQNVFSPALQYFNFNLAQATLLVPDDWDYNRSGIISYMGRVNYSYQDRFSATATVRSDASSRLAEGNQWFVYPALAVAWSLHNEAFMENIANTISNLKLRVGWGRTSNQAIPAYASLGQLTSSVYNFGDDGIFGFTVSNLPNPSLEWEFTTSKNIGIDFGLIANRITGSIDYYHNNTDNVLQSRALPITSGVPGSFLENIGETQGKGVEIMLDALIIEPQSAGGFTLNANVNFTSHRGKILALSSGVTQDVGNGWFVGQPIDVIYDFEKIGIWQLGEEAEALAAEGLKPGDIKVKDLNGDGGVIDATNDRRILGSLSPDFTAGFTIRAGYKGVDFSVVSYARSGGLLNSTLFGNMSLEGRQNQVKVDYWTPNNPTNAYPRSGDQFPVHGSTLGYFSGSFLKIRSINLGYNLPSELMDMVGFGSARVYVSATNPFKALFSDYVDAGGLDPETNQRQADNATIAPGRLSVGGQVPVTKQILFGVNLTF